MREEVSYPLLGIDLLAALAQLGTDEWHHTAGFRFKLEKIFG